MSGLLFTLLFFPFIGLAVSRITGRVPLFLAGAGAWGGLLFVAGALRVPLTAAAAVLVVAAGLVVWRVRGEARPPRVQYPLLPTILLWCLVAAFLFISLVVPLHDYDGRAFWLLKAKAIANERQIDGPHFQGENAVTLRNEYPILVPIDAATVMAAAGELDDRHVRWLYVGFAAALALEVRRRLAPLTSPAIAAWSAVVLLALPQIATDLEGGALSASCDVPLAAFVACALFELVEGRSPARLAMWLSFAALTKQEGLPFSLVLAAAGAFVFRRRMMAAAAPLLIAVGALLVWRAQIPSSDEENLTALLLTFPAQIDRLPHAAVVMARYLFAWQDWGPLWAVAIASAGLLVWRREWKIAALVAIAILPMMLMYVAVYSVTGWNTEELASTSASRLLTHFVGPLILAIAVACSRRRTADRANRDGETATRPA